MKLTILAVFAVVSASSAVSAQESATDSKSAPSVSPAAPDAAAKDEFKIGAEDVIYIRVMHETDLTGPQDVRPDGMISLQLVGEIKAAGRTPGQLAQDIRDKLLATIRSPEVSVQVVRINSRKFTIHGEVVKPGTYTFGTPITVLEAIVSGGGFKDFANEKKIYILRNGKKLPFNYKAVSKGKHMEQNVQVESGDQIFVP